MQCSAKNFQNLGQYPAYFEKVGTFPKIVGHKPLIATLNQKKINYGNTKDFNFTSNYHNYVYECMLTGPDTCNKMNFTNSLKIVCSLFVFLTTTVFCRARDPARISRKFQQSCGRNILVANLVAAEFYEIINFFTVYGFYWLSSIKNKDIIGAKMKALAKRKVKLFTIPRSFNFYTHSSSHLIISRAFPARWRGTGQSRIRPRYSDCTRCNYATASNFSISPSD